MAPACTSSVAVIWPDLADDAFSGPIVRSQEQLSLIVAEFWATVGGNTGFEWFHWLAERMAEREARTLHVPAYVAHRHWKTGDLGGRA